MIQILVLYASKCNTRLKIRLKFLPGGGAMYIQMMRACGSAPFSQNMTIYGYHGIVPMSSLLFINIVLRFFAYFLVKVLFCLNNNFTFSVYFECFCFVSVQSKHRNTLFRYRTETTETNLLFRIDSKLVSVPVSVVSNRN
jgi:hypothetical protein